METNDILRRRKARPMVRTSVELTPEFYNLCVTNHIRFVDAMRTGVSVLLAESGVQEYDNRLNVYRQMRSYQEKLESALKRLEELEQGKNIKEVKVDPKGIDIKKSDPFLEEVDKELDNLKNGKSIKNQERKHL